MNTVTDVVAQKIAEISPVVNEKVIEALVARELDKRTDAIVAGMDKLSGLKNEMYKIRPDLGGAFDEDGNETKPTLYSKAKFEERKKLKEQIEKLERTLESAIEKGDMSKLKDIK